MVVGHEPDRNTAAAETARDRKTAMRAAKDHGTSWLLRRRFGARSPQIYRMPFDLFCRQHVATSSTPYSTGS